MLSLALADGIFADGAMSNGTQLAMHHGKAHEGSRHELHHGMGQGGKGVCPQMRTVPQAPDTFIAMKNPLSSTAKSRNAGESLFQLQAEPTACKICHGPNGNGLGMMAQGAGAVPRNFTCVETMKDISDGQLFWVIKNGSGGTGMPAYKFLSDNQIWQLILYLRNFSG
ncbi:MAG: cytochrome C [Nitrospinae bacterium RIFCSPLOWO2_12_FULL_47_7]|nr:MAG: cytochrome C [Nitrospinae bacterium RIFCSPLOWO2_12_FULL_47_7]